MKKFVHVATGITLLAAGVVAGRFASTPWSPKGGVAPSRNKVEIYPEPTVANAPRSLDDMLCKIAGGSLAGAKTKIGALLKAQGGNDKELVSLLVAIAEKDGATFDAILVGVPAERKAVLLKECVARLKRSPAHLLRLLADSTEISRYVWQAVPNPAFAAVRTAPDIFVEMAQDRRFPWTLQMTENLLREVNFRSDSAARVLALIDGGHLKVSDEKLIARLIERLGPGDLERLRAKGAGKTGSQESKLAKLLDEEAKARSLFANFDLTGKSLGEIPAHLLLSGIDKMIATSGFPSGFEWGGVPGGSRDLLAERMLLDATQSQGGEGAAAFLKSLNESSLSAGERDKILEKSAKILFERGSDIRLAVEFVNVISNDEAGLRTGRDLISRWAVYDPKGAKEYAERLEDTPFSNEILQRVAELSP